MALGDVAPVLAKDFVILKIDQDRMVGGNELLARYRKQAGGLPWFVFLEGDGKVVSTSDDPDRGNIGYPGWGGSESHFRNMLQAAARNITPAEIDALVTSVKAFRTVKLTQ